MTKGELIDELDKTISETEKARDIAVCVKNGTRLRSELDGSIRAMADVISRLRSLRSETWR